MTIGLGHYLTVAAILLSSSSTSATVARSRSRISTWWKG